MTKTTTCGECFIKPGETCNICGLTEPIPAECEVRSWASNVCRKHGTKGCVRDDHNTVGRAILAQVAE